jgi:hypothetical protein
MLEDFVDDHGVLGLKVEQAASIDACHICGGWSLCRYNCLGAKMAELGGTSLCGISLNILSARDVEGD